VIPRVGQKGSWLGESDAGYGTASGSDLPSLANRLAKPDAPNSEGRSLPLAAPYQTSRHPSNQDTTRAANDSQGRAEWVLAWRIDGMYREQ
jgi:hypothetical protein